MTLQARLTIEFRSFWCMGTGGGRGRHLDAVCHRDKDGFPAMPVSHLKGLWREAAERLTESGVTGWNQDLVKHFFGTRTEDGQPGQESALDFGAEARLSEAARTGSDPSAFFHRIPATRINEYGVAEDRTLRYVEAVRPCTLEAKIAWEGKEPLCEDWIALLDQAAAGILALGKQKNDGFGQAIVTVSEAEHASAEQAVSIPDSLQNAFEAYVVLRQERDVVFSARAATESAHKTLPAPTGAALLGWCAAEGPYEDFGDPFGVFHSGAVRFLDAVPVSPDGELAIPIPRNLFAPKEAPEPLASEQLSVGPPVNAGETQFTAIKDKYLFPGKCKVKQRFGQRLRTATTDGRAARGQLFGFQHIDTKAEPVYAARISRDKTICDKDWLRILCCFSGRRLAIGKGRRTGYGGGFHSQVQEIREEGHFPSVSESSGPVTVLALSDLALVGANGSPALEPAPEMVGLPESYRLDLRKSILSFRRYSPWNGILRSRDIERQVIEAGSVMVFEPSEGDDAPVPSGRRTVGMWQENGLGNIWINPGLFKDNQLDGEVSFGRIVLPEPSRRMGDRP